MDVRGKFFVMRVQKSHAKEEGVMIELGAVSASDKEKSENTFYHSATPSGKIEMYIANPTAARFFTLGKTVYVDFSEAPAE